MFRKNLYWLLGGLLLSLALLWPRLGLAHSSGFPVLADKAAGPYRLFAYIQPEQLNVGNAHIAVAVTLAPAKDNQNNGLLQPVNDAQVRLRWEPTSQPTQAFTVAALSQSALSDMFYETDVAIPFADLWRVTIEVEGLQGAGSATFERQVFAERQFNWRLIVGASATLGVLIALMVLWQRTQQPTQSAPKLVP
jgi:hypothetical protein